MTGNKEASVLLDEYLNSVRPIAEMVYHNKTTSDILESWKNLYSFVNMTNLLCAALDNSFKELEDAEVPPQDLLNEVRDMIKALGKLAKETQ